MKIWHTIALVLVIGIAALAYYALSPLFVSVEVHEPEPQDTNIILEEGTMKVNAAFSITGTTGHPAEGAVRIVESDGTRYLRYENFKTINGPDLYVYLATDLEAKEFIDLGRLKATEGNLNYEIPEGVDLEKYRYALVWCKAFGVLFNYAELAE